MKLSKWIFFSYHDPRALQYNAENDYRTYLREEGFTISDCRDRNSWKEKKKFKKMENSTCFLYQNHDYIVSAVILLYGSAIPYPNHNWY